MSGRSVKAVALVVAAATTLAACGAASTAAAPTTTLDVPSFCAEYHRVMASSPMAALVPGADPANPPTGSVPAPSESQVRQFFTDLAGLAGRAPLEIRADLQTVWAIPAYAGLAPLPGSETPGPTGIPAERNGPMQRAVTWLSDHCDPTTGPTPPPPLAGPPPLPGVTPPVPPPAGPPPVVAPGSLPGIGNPVGDWQPINSGTTAEAHWTVYRAASTLPDEVCFAVDTDPPLSPVSALNLPGVTYQGKVRWCGPYPDAFQHADPVEFFVEQELHGGPVGFTPAFNLLAGAVLPATRTVTVTFDDSTTTTVTPADDTFVVTYPTGRHVSAVTPDLAGGGHVRCTPMTTTAPPGVPAPAALELGCEGSVNRPPYR